MAFYRKSRLLPCLLLFSAVSPALAVSPVTLSGGLGGTVRDSAGKPQMGAAVALYDFRDQLLERALTNESGAFSFGGLNPSLYSVRVTLASFLPALRDGIKVQAGMRRFLDVNLSHLFSSIQFGTPDPGTTALMSDDWKWTARTSGSMRPILRILPVSGTLTLPNRPSAFSESRGLVRVSGGDTGSSDTYSNDADVGTAFAFSTSLYGANQLQFSGNLGYVSAGGLPSTAFRAAFSKPFLGGNPVLAVTVRQVSVPERVNGIDGSVPHFRTSAISLGDKAKISDSLDLEYGFELDSISYIDRMHYFSPYAKVTYHLDDTKVDFTYTSGNARPDLGAAPSASHNDLEHDVSALGRVPRVSLHDGRAKVQRGEDYELGVSRRIGSREYRVAAYRESVSNAALTMVSPGGDLFSGDLLPDLLSNTALFNAGDYHTIGYTTSVTQNLGEQYKLVVNYGLVGVLVPETGSLNSTNADDLRARIHAQHRQALTTQLAATVKQSGTRVLMSYQFSSYRSATSGHLYSTQPTHPEPGLNVYLRQPIPGVPGLPGRMEVTADMRNMLAQGYLPFDLPDGRRLLLMRTPRSVRGGLNFTF